MKLPLSLLVALSIAACRPPAPVPVEALETVRWCAPQHGTYAVTFEVATGSCGDLAPTTVDADADEKTAGCVVATAGKTWDSCGRSVAETCDDGRGNLAKSLTTLRFVSNGSTGGGTMRVETWREDGTFVCGGTYFVTWTRTRTPLTAAVSPPRLPTFPAGDVEGP